MDEDRYAAALADALRAVRRPALLVGLANALPWGMVALLLLGHLVSAAPDWPVHPKDARALAFDVLATTAFAPETFGQVVLAVAVATWASQLRWAEVPVPLHVRFGARVGLAWGVRAGALIALGGLAFRLALIASGARFADGWLAVLPALGLAVAFAGAQLALAAFTGGLTGAALAVTRRLSATQPTSPSRLSETPP